MNAGNKYLPEEINVIISRFKALIDIKSSKNPVHSGFDAPVKGTIYPKGTKFITDENGYLVPVLPDGGGDSGKSQ